MSRQQPTVGRMVYLMVHNPIPGIPPARPGHPYAAFITGIHANNNISIRFFDAAGGDHPMDSVPLVQDGDTIPGGDYYCTFIPHETGHGVPGDAYNSNAAKSAAKAAATPSTGTAAAQEPDAANRAAGNPTTGGMTPKDPTHSAEAIKGNGQAIEGGPLPTEAERLATAGSVGNPTAGGLTPVDPAKPAPAAEQVKETAQREAAKTGKAIQAEEKKIAADVSKPVKKGATAKNAAPAKKAAKK